MMRPGKPASRRSALSVPADPIHDVLGFLCAGGVIDENVISRWFEGCDGDFFNEMSNELADEFRGAPLGDEALAPHAAAVLTNVGAAGTPPERTEPVREPARCPPTAANLASTSSPSRSDDSSSGDEEDDVSDPCFHPKAKKRVRGTARRPTHKQQPRGPTGQWKRKSVPAPAPLVAVVVVEDNAARCCQECKTTQTTQWRAGPGGPNTLCNACGLRWKKKRAPATAKHQPAARMSHAKSKNSLYVSPLNGEGNVATKQRSATVFLD